MSWTFAKDAVTKSVQNPLRDNLEDLSKRQALSRSVGGDIYVYNKGTQRQKLTAIWNELRDSERDDLQDFFDSTVLGMVNTFTLTDHEGNVWTARFILPVLEWRQRADARASSGTFTSDGVDYPTTTRENPVWGITLELEVEAV
jgi:hypothetical protein